MNFFSFFYFSAEKYGKPYFKIKNFLNTETREIFISHVANVSLRGEGDLKIPNMFSSEKLQKEICELFQEIHDEIKKELRQKQKK